MPGPADRQTSSSELHVVTGAFGYTGGAIARQLIAAGRRVRTLTNHPRDPDPFAGALEVAPLDFEDFGGLVKSLAGAAALYNTYWVRFSGARCDA
jgi:nucleoside-diphosphate-sugar epimerase